MKKANAILTAPVQAVRRIAIIVIIVSLSISALIGIVTLLTGSGFGETQGKIMLSTLVIGVFGVLSLCDLAVAGKRYQWSGYLGIIASAVALAVGLYLIWSAGGSEAQDTLWKTLALASIAAVSFAHANLLLLLANRRRTAVKVGLWATIGLIAALAILLALLIITDGDIGTDAYARLIGTVAILDVLGTIVVPVIGAILRDGAQVSGTVPLTILVPHELDARLADVAAVSGDTKEAVALAVIRQYLNE